jgi:hypothetical protein
VPNIPCLDGALTFALPPSPHEILGWYPDGINDVDDDNMTALHYATENHNVKCTSVLLAHKAASLALGPTLTPQPNARPTPRSGMSLKVSWRWTTAPRMSCGSSCLSSQRGAPSKQALWEERHELLRMQRAVQRYTPAAGVGRGGGAVGLH